MTLIQDLSSNPVAMAFFFNRVVFHEKETFDSPSYTEISWRFDRLDDFIFTQVGQGVRYLVKTSGKRYENGAIITMKEEPHTFLIGGHKDDYIYYNYKKYELKDFPKLAQEIYDRNIERSLKVLDE